MMKIENFTNEIIQYLEQEQPSNVYKSISVLKNNGIRRYGINVSTSEGNVSPCLYVDKCYEEYVQGKKTLYEIQREMQELLEQSICESNFNLSEFYQWKKVKSKIACRLINKDRNEELLQDVPYRDFLDLAIVYEVIIDSTVLAGSENASILIHNVHLKLWEKDEKDLFEQVQENMERNRTAVCKSLYDILKDAYQMDEDISLAHPSMYVLSNLTKMYGAAELVNISNLENASQLLGGDFIVLPCSVHETILIPASDAKEESELANMVKDVNDNELSAEEILSYHVYKFFASEKELRIVA